MGAACVTSLLSEASDSKPHGKSVCSPEQNQIPTAVQSRGSRVAQERAFISSILFIIIIQSMLTVALIKAESHTGCSRETSLGRFLMIADKPVPSITLQTPTADLVTTYWRITLSQRARNNLHRKIFKGNNGCCSRTPSCRYSSFAWARPRSDFEPWADRVTLSFHESFISLTH